MGTQITDAYATPGGARTQGSPFAPRLAVLASTIFVLVGCAGMERHTPASGFPDVLNAEEMANQSPTYVIEERQAAVMATEPAATALPACAPESSGYRVRDLSVPWTRRRYLMANGTICIPNRVGAL